MVSDTPAPPPGLWQNHSASNKPNAVDRRLGSFSCKAAFRRCQNQLKPPGIFLRIRPGWRTAAGKQILSVDCAEQTVQPKRTPRPVTVPSNATPRNIFQCGNGGFIPKNPGGRLAAARITRPSVP